MKNSRKSPPAELQPGATMADHVRRVRRHKLERFQVLVSEPLAKGWQKLARRVSKEHGIPLKRAKSAMLGLSVAGFPEPDAGTLRILDGQVILHLHNEETHHKLGYGPSGEILYSHNGKLRKLSLKQSVEVFANIESKGSKLPDGSHDVGARVRWLRELVSEL